MHKLTEVNELGLAEVKDLDKSFADDAWQVAVGEHGDAVDALALVVGLSDQVLVDVLEVRNGHVLLELLVLQDSVINEL